MEEVEDETPCCKCLKSDQPEWVRFAFGTLSNEPCHKKTCLWG